MGVASHVECFTNKAAVLHAYSHLLDRMIADIGTTQQLSSAALALMSWGLVAAACVVAWRLFTGYLHGRIFTSDAVAKLRTIAVLGLIAVAFDLAARVAISMILSGEVQSLVQFLPKLIRIDDLLLALFLGALVAMAHIFAVAAEISDEQALIV